MKDVGAVKMVGVPYARAVEHGDGWARVCPVCNLRIPEAFSKTGEQLTKNYLEHYVTVHLEEDGDA